MRKRGHYHGIVCNESLTKNGKPKKTLSILNINWGSPTHNGLNPTRVHVNAIFRNNITQEFHFRLMESTLLQGENMVKYANEKKNGWKVSIN
jgi:hypothetical protein